MHSPLISITAALLLSCALRPARAAEGSAEGDRPPFETLFALNAEKIFGVKVDDKDGVTYKDGAMTLAFGAPGQLQRVFEGTGMLVPDQVRGDHHRKILNNAENKAWDRTVVIGRPSGAWKSKFELSGRVKLSFKLRIPEFPKGWDLKIALIQGPKAALSTSFFQTATLSGVGKPKRATSPKEYLAPPEKWFDLKGLVPVELLQEKGVFTVKLAEKEVLKLEGTEEIGAGAIVFTFQKLTFLMTDVRIEGNLNQAWIEAQFKELEEKNQLTLKAPEQEKGNQHLPSRASTKKPLEKEAREKEAKEEL